MLIKNSYQNPSKLYIIYCSLAGFVAPESEMPGHHAINTQVAKGAHMGKRQVNETEKRRTTGQPYQPVIVQHHVT